MSRSQDNEALYGWTKMEKFNLLQALKSYGSNNIISIHEVITTKTPDQIKEAIEHYKSRALGQPIAIEKTKRDRSDVNSNPRLPLASWAKYLTDNMSYEELQTETAAALRLIAEFDDIPPALYTNNINFKKIYHIIANAMEGKSLLEDKYSALVIDKCIMDTALSSKAFIRNSSLKYVIDTIDMSEKERNQFARPTKNNELALMQHLASEKNYNPLSIGNNHLKASR